MWLDLDDNLPRIPDTYPEYKKMFEKDTMNAGIFNLSAPYDNPYQGNRPRILFVCSAGLLRSPTGAYVAQTRGYNSRACGSHTEYALIPISVNLIEWAQHIVFVNRENFIRAKSDFGDLGYDEDLDRKSITLDIPDKYEAFHPYLIQSFNDWFDQWESQKNGT